MGPPKQRRPRGRHDTDESESKTITDPRFANVQTDPRFRLPSRKDTHTKIDSRFSRILEDEDFSKKANVDRYGRRVAVNAGKKELERLYRVENEDEAEESDIEVDDVNVDDIEEPAERAKTYDPARDGGFSESESSSEDSSEEDSSEDEESDEDILGLDVAREDEVAELEAKEEISEDDITPRLAVVNMDWDNIRAVDLMAVANSFCPSGGQILNVAVYPSDYGKEQMEKEQIEGPAKELFTSKKTKRKKNKHRRPNSPSPELSDSKEDERIKQELLEDQVEDGVELNSTAFRKYQLSRLRYYYAVITCNSSPTAHALYKDMDGREYLSTANFFDLRFVPTETTFEEEPRDSCDKMPEGYRPNEFVTEALTHSNVKLTWDLDNDKKRKEIQKQAFSNAELDENDLKAYIGSDSSDDDAPQPDVKVASLTGSEAAAQVLAPKLTKADEARRKLRAALGLPIDDDTATSQSKSSKTGTSKKTRADEDSMQITFMPGLSANGSAAKASIFENQPEDVRNETTREKYLRKEKERKQRRKERAQAVREGINGGEDQPMASDPDDGGVQPDAGFEDSFFENPAAANAAAKKAAKKGKREKFAKEAARSAGEMQRQREELELLMAGEEEPSGSFGKDKNGKSSKGKKGKKGRNKPDRGEGADDAFELNVQDPRFTKVFEDTEYAIDPSNPKFSGTSGMKKMLEEGRKVREKNAVRGDRLEMERGMGKGGKRGPEVGNGGVQEMVMRIKKRKVA